MMFRFLRRLAMRERGAAVDKMQPSAAVDPHCPPDFHPELVETVERVRPYTMTSPQRIGALCDSVSYIVRHEIPGAIVECGVWRGGSMMAAALTLLRLGQGERELYLFDTFEGMTPPGCHDVDFQGRRADRLLSRQARDDPQSLWCVSSLEEVQRNMESTGYPRQRIHYVAGRVERTLPDRAPSRIAILRLDTDWYDSTRHELEHLFPRLVPGGVLIVDDYGHWNGARRAVDEFIQFHKVLLLLHRIDYTGRIGVVLPGNQRPAA